MEHWTIKGKGKKIVKTAHLLFAATVFGALATLFCFLLFTRTNVPIDSAAFEGNLFKTFVGVIQYAFAGLVITSLLYGLFTEWGFFRHYWIIAKWALVLVVFGIAWFGFLPAVSGMVSIADALFYSAALRERYLAFHQTALALCGIELLILIAVFFLSVLKPWGKTKRTSKVKKTTVLGVLSALVVILAVFITANTIKLHKIRSMPIANVELSSKKDGVYYGEEKAGSFLYKVKVEIKNQRIVSIEDLSSRASPYVDYAKGVFHKVIEEQRTDVDAVSGATTTSKAYLKAVENALSAKVQQ